MAEQSNVLVFPLKRVSFAIASQYIYGQSSSDSIPIFLSKLEPVLVQFLPKLPYVFSRSDNAEAAYFFSLQANSMAQPPPGYESIGSPYISGRFSLAGWDNNHLFAVFPGQ